jgi:hypothetical protein
MSLPVSAMPALVTSAGPFELAVQSINTSPVFVGLMMLLMNLGGRFLPFEISKTQESILQHPYVRRFMIFVLLFMGTRSVVTAFWMSIIIILFIGYFFNENSSLCVWRGGVAGSTCSMKEGFADAPKLSPEEQNILNILREKERKLMESQQTMGSVPSEKFENMDVPIEKYKQIMNVLKKH